MAKKKPGVISVNIKADELGLSFENIATAAEAEFNQAIADVAHAVHANIVAQATTKLKALRQDYLKDLTFDKVGENSYVIGLAGEWANKIEDGFPSYDLRSTLLGSNKIVGVGSRSGQPWVQRSPKDDHKYAHVPFEHKPFSKEAKSQNLADAIKKLTARNMAGKEQKLTQIFKDPNGRPLQGKVASVKDTGVSNLDGLVKYQKVHKNKAGKETTQSIYMTYRTISEASKAWMHPGFSGLKAFPEAEQAAEQMVEQILRSFLK